MAYEEYLNLYLSAQSNKDAPYYVVSFDVIGSTSLPDDEKLYMIENIETIMRYVYKRLLRREKKLNKQVLIKDERFCTPWSPKSRETWRRFFMDPFCLWDCFQFTVLRDTIPKDQIIKWVYECKEKIGMKEEFHITDGYYETNEYGEGGTKFYRGYCLLTLGNFHKPFIQNRLKNIKRRIRKKESNNNEVKK